MILFGYGTKNIYPQSSLKGIYYRLCGIMFNDYLRYTYIEKIIETNFPNTSKKLKIFDAGAGEGNYSYYFAKKYKNSTIDYYEIDQKLYLKNKIHIKKKKINNINCYNKLIEDNKEKNHYDCALLLGILEYNNNIKKLIKSVHRNLKKGGILIIFAMGNREKNYFKVKLSNNKVIKDGDRKQKGFNKLSIKKYFSIFSKTNYIYKTNKFNLLLYVIYQKSNKYIRILISPLFKIILKISNYFLKNNRFKNGMHIIIISKK